MASDAFKYYYYILQYSPLIPLVYGAVYFRRFDKPMKIFMSYLAISLSLTIIMTALSLQKMNNLWLMNLSLPLYMVLLIWMYSLWQRDSIIQKLMLGSIPIFTVVWLVEMIFYDRFFEFTKVSRPLQGLMLTLVSFYAIYQITKESDEPIIELPQFWISAGIMIYYGGMLLTNLFSSIFFRSSMDSLRMALSIQPALSLVAHLFYLGGYVWKCRQPICSGLSSSAHP